MPTLDDPLCKTLNRRRVRSGSAPGFDAQSRAVTPWRFLAATVLFVAVLWAPLHTAQAQVTLPPTTDKEPNSVGVFTGSVAAQVGGLVGDNIGLRGSGALIVARQHRIGLEGFIAGGSYLRGGLGVRYDLSLIHI